MAKILTIERLTELGFTDVSGFASLQGHASLYECNDLFLVFEDSEWTAWVASGDDLNAPLDWHPLTVIKDESHLQSLQSALIK